MPTVPLPDDPDLDQLRTQAKELRDAVRAGDTDALASVAEHDPDARSRPVFQLSDAQRVIARRHGFSSWPSLHRHLEMIARYRRTPDLTDGDGDPADRFLALACLRYGHDDGPERWADARRLLTDHPSIVRSIHVAAATADPERVAASLAEDSAAANREGGPFRWPPLLYLAYARHDPGVTARRTAATARALLSAGADPNAGYLWHGMTSPFTAVTGALGGGELDQPAHPHGLELATALLDAGADANDPQALYNRQFGDDDGHLTLLLAHGLGLGDGGPWRRRLGPAIASPTELVRVQLWWAIVHDMRARVGLLNDHGADVTTPFENPPRPAWARAHSGKSPAQVAALTGSPDLAAWLVARGAAPPPTSGAEAFVAATLAGDRPRAREADPATVEQVRRTRPGLLTWSAGHGRFAAVELLLDLGFDVDGRGRSDVPIEQPWQTALHEAAHRGDLALARLLLRRGADPNTHDARFGATPLGWAHHAHHQPLVALLEPITSADE